MTVIKNKDLHLYRKQNTRPIDIGGGQTRIIGMTPLLWDNLEFLQVVEGMTTPELARFAFEETQLQPGESFEKCFRGVVAHLANRWTA